MTLVIAHRGASAERPEQTRAAYALALAQGADGLECDVRLTADGHVVCFHDATVDRTLGGTGAVADLTLAQLRERGGDELLTLDELLGMARTAGRPVILAIELKHPNVFGNRIEQAVLAVLDAAGWDRTTATLNDVTVSLMSFNPMSVQALGIDPQLVMVLTADLTIADLASELPDADASDAGATDAEAAAAALSAALTAGHQLIDAGVVGGAGPDVDFARAHPERVRAWIAAGRTVRVWTADTPDDIDYLVGLGVQEITTNTPRTVLDHLRSTHAQ